MTLGIAAAYLLGVACGGIPQVHPLEVVCATAAFAAIYLMRRRHE